MNKIHLGSGICILDGWINMDLIDNPKVVKYDLRKPFPFEDASIDFFFSEHFIEHLTREEGVILLREVYRCLTPGGVSRVTTPDLEFLIRSYLTNNLKAYSGVGFKCSTKCSLMNSGMRLWEHKFVYDLDELKLIHLEAGFRFCNPVKHRVSEYQELNNLEVRPFTGEIICEAVK